MNLRLRPLGDLKLAFLVVFTLLASTVSAANIDCDGEMAETYWQLPGKAQQLVIGMLGETENGTRVLSVADYFWGFHHVLYDHLSRVFHIKRILWSGELLLENDSFQAGKSTVHSSLNVSGFSHKILQPKNEGHVNDPKILEESLATFRPELITQFTQHLSFSDQFSHLDPLMRLFHERIKPDNKDSGARHRFRNMMPSFIYLAGKFKKNPPTSQQEQDAITNLVKPETLEDIYVFLESRSRFSHRRSGTLLTPWEALASATDVRAFPTFVNLVTNAGMREIKDEKPEYLILDFK